MKDKDILRIKIPGTPTDNDRTPEDNPTALAIPYKNTQRQSQETEKQS